MKRLSKKEFAFLVRIAKNVEGPKNKIEALNKKKAELDAQIEEQQQLIDAFEIGSVAITGGFTSTQLLEKKTVAALDSHGVQKVGKDGAPATTTKYVPMPGVLEEYDGYYTIVATDEAGATESECETVNHEEE